MKFMWWHIPAAIKNRDPRRNRLKGARERVTLATEKPPVFGMVQRDGQVRIVMLANVQQKTIKPFIEQTISKGTLIYTDEYAIYNRLEAWGYAHKTVNHSAGEYARDEDGDGFHEVHVNKMEGFGHYYVRGYAASGHFSRKTSLVFGIF